MILQSAQKVEAYDILIYIFVLSQMSQFLPVQQRPSWNTPIQILVSSPRSEKNLQESSTFPVINISPSKNNTGDYWLYNFSTYNKLFLFYFYSDSGYAKHTKFMRCHFENLIHVFYLFAFKSYLLHFCRFYCILDKKDVCKLYWESGFV